MRRRGIICSSNTMASHLFDFAVITIFAREFLEGAIIIGEYRTIILRGDALEPHVRKDAALREVTISALFATAFALVVIAAIAIPLAVLSHNFDSTTSNIIEGVSKIVAAICLLQLSLKLPKFLGIYGSCKKSSESSAGRLTLRSIRFNVAWNIWREVAECGVFLIPFFLSGQGLESIPLSAVVGSVVGLALGVAIYVANKRLQDRRALALFATLLLIFLSAGLFSGGSNKLEKEINMTLVVYQLNGSFWDVEKLPMTILKPFGYSDTRTILQILCYWLWLLLSALLHYRKYRRAPKIERSGTADLSHEDKLEEGAETVEVGESTWADSAAMDYPNRGNAGGSDADEPTLADMMVDYPNRSGAGGDDTRRFQCSQ